jgi:molybdopterin converting factor small subunit
VHTCRIEESAIRRFDPEGLSFLNMNTPDDYARAQQLWTDLHFSARPAHDELISCTVELFGMARLIAKTKIVELQLPQEATLADLLVALAEQLPSLVGRVISPEKNNLMSGCACNVNGLEFVRDPDVKIRTGDKILIISADAGG